MLDVYSEGILVDLAIPTVAFAKGEIWYRWLNDSLITKFLADQGMFPNTAERQEAYFRGLDDTRVVFVAQTKDGEPRGVVSLSHISWQRRHADLAIILDYRVEPRTSPLAALEACALLLEHGVDKIGLQRIQGSQHKQVSRWQQRLELLGFRLEGIHRLGFVKGATTADSLTAAATADDINLIRELRGGTLFDCPDKMSERLKALPPRSMSEELESFFVNIGNRYYSEIFRL